MNGKDLKEKLRAEGVNFSALAQKMGYTTDQNLHSVLGAKDVRSGLIEDLAHALDKPIGWFYGEPSVTQAADNGGIAVAGDNNTVATISERFISLLEKKDEQIDTLLEIIKKN